MRPERDNQESRTFFKRRCGSAMPFARVTGRPWFQRLSSIGSRQLPSDGWRAVSGDCTFGAPTDSTGKTPNKLIVLEVDARLLSHGATIPCHSNLLFLRDLRCLAVQDIQASCTWRNNYLKPKTVPNLHPLCCRRLDEFGQRRWGSVVGASGASLLFLPLHRRYQRETGGLARREQPRETVHFVGCRKRGAACGRESVLGQSNVLVKRN